METDPVKVNEELTLQDTFGNESKPMIG